MPLAEVVTLYDTNCRDIPEMLRGAADQFEIEAGEGMNTEAMIAVRLTDTGGIEIFGWGDADNLKAMALLQLGHMSLANATLGWEE